jgi:hypothetical protein
MRKRPSGHNIKRGQGAWHPDATAGAEALRRRHASPPYIQNLNKLQRYGPDDGVPARPTTVNSRARCSAEFSCNNLPISPVKCRIVCALRSRPSRKRAISSRASARSCSSCVIRVDSEEGWDLRAGAIVVDVNGEIGATMGSGGREGGAAETGGVGVRPSIDTASLTIAACVGCRNA